MIAMQQCMFCHGAETGNNFVHVISRSGSSTRSGLSCFLAGPGGNHFRHPFRQLQGEDRSAMCAVRVEFPAAGEVDYGDLEVRPCGSERCESRYFNELARRGVHMAGLLLRQDEDRVAMLPPQQFRIFRNLLVGSYATRMTH